jgi:dUTPase
MSEIPTFYFTLREDLLNNKEFLPTKAEPHATGYDVRAAQPDRKDIIIKPYQYFRIPLGFKAFPQNDWWFQLHPRSSSFAKKHIHTHVGIIDMCFELENLYLGQYLPNYGGELENKDLVIKFGEPIGQIVPVKRVDMNVIEISDSKYKELSSLRGGERIGGIGSTDIKR